MEMEDKAVISILGVLTGVSMGLGIWDIVKCRRIYNQKIVMDELMKLVIDGKDTGVTFDDFPYFLSEKVKILLTNAGYVHLTQHRLSKHTWNLSPIRQSILLSGPAEFYQEKLAKALAHYFKSKLLILDVNSFSLEKKYECPTEEPVSSTTAPLKCTNSFCVNEDRFLDSLYKVLVSISESDSVILYIKDVKKIFLKSHRMYILFQNLLNKLSGSVLVLGSRTYKSEDKCTKVNKRLTALFPCNVEIKQPKDATGLKIWKEQLEEDVKNTQLKDTQNRISKLLAENDIECDDLNSIDHKDIMQLNNLSNEIVSSAIFYQLKDNKNPEYRNGKLIISAESMLAQRGSNNESNIMRRIKNEFMSHWDGLLSKPDARVNLCTTAAYRPVKELLQQEKDNQDIALRPLNMEDMRQAKNKVAASFAAEGSMMNRLKEWNDIYGEGENVVMMEEKIVLGLGVLAGVCMAVIENIVRYRRVSNQMSSEDHQKIVMNELMKLVIDGKDNGVTFNDFPYFLSEKVKILLTSAGFVHLTQHRLSKHTRNLSPISQSILLSGPAEFYQEKLAKALAHYFESKLLVLDVNSFSSEKKYKCPTEEPVSSTTAPLKCTSSFCFDENRFLDSLYKVLVFISESDSVILYIKDVEKIFLQSRRMYRLFQNLLSKLSGTVLVLGSRTYNSEDKCTEVDKRLTKLFPCNIEIKLPQDKSSLKIWKVQLEVAVKTTQLKDNRNRIAKVLAANDIECDHLNSIDHKDIMLLSNLTNEIAASTIFYQLMDNKIPEYRNGKLIISAKSLCHVSRVFQEGETAKVAPTVIFIDEVDSVLPRRGSSYEHGTMRRIQNEFMSHWDGLLSKPDERIVVLGATNMPFDLDEAVIRRFQRRICARLQLIAPLRSYCNRKRIIVWFPSGL
ncbi:hypothetical protein TSUD_43710 [Trifolium subterraneum]|uniref:DUF7751 domain-containing protein n=1 Tax=Trifolium subterraneum TaxID=3900 RepID=A0A2Z6MJL7_TRISU|nr:hypothetical protein TSUD_43710 [Trifolium subterraneum]